MSSSRVTDKLLSPQQKAAIRNTVDLIQDFMTGYATAEEESPADEETQAADVQDHQRKTEEDFASFGLFGARGSGKSTVLEKIYNNLRGGSANQLHVCWPPLDCTTLPPDIPLGISLTSYLKENIRDYLKARAENGRSPRREPKGSPEDPLVVKKFDGACAELMESYLPLDRHYRELKLSLAVTVSEYSEIAQRELGHRQRIESRVDTWIKSVLPLLGAGTRRILVFLEDADLAVGRLNPRVLATFLHDFSNHRLMFLMVADEDHLSQRFSQDEEHAGGVSGLTKERLLDKLIPFHHRVDLTPWHSEDALDFKAPGENSPDSSSLQKLIEDEVSAMAIQVRDVVPLLPRHPRGLLDLYRRLHGHRSEGSSGRPRLSTEEMIVLLAQCRGEGPLARKLPLRRLDWWAARFAWSLENVRQTSWERVAFEARRGEPIWALEAEPSRPLNLPQGTDDALWTELILNVACRSDPEFLRVGFLQQFSPLSEQLPFCRCVLQPAPRVLARMSPVLPSLLACPWFRWLIAEDRTVRIHAGWSPLFKAGGPSYESDILEISRKLGARAGETVALEKRAEILPADVRSLVLLTDNVSRLPWVQIQEWAEDRVSPEFLHILAILCGNAYYQTLVDCLRIEKKKLPSAVTTVEFADLKKKNLDELKQERDRLRQGIEELDLERSDHPIARATLGFLRGPWFLEPAKEDASA